MYILSPHLHGWSLVAYLTPESNKCPNRSHCSWASSLAVGREQHVRNSVTMIHFKMVGTKKLRVKIFVAQRGFASSLAETLTTSRLEWKWSSAGFSWVFNSHCLYSGPFPGKYLDDTIWTAEVISATREPLSYRSLAGVREAQSSEQSQHPIGYYRLQTSGRV